MSCKTVRKDMFKGAVPPPNTPYALILSSKGEGYLRGWINCDKAQDPKGHAIRMNIYKTWLKNQE